MELTFEAKVVLVLEYKEGDTKSKHVSTDFNLDFKSPIGKELFLDADDLPTKGGADALSMVLVQGLVGNIHYAHEKGFKDSAEHLRWIIHELEEGFAAVTDIKKSTFK
jgi:hypothetical protein